MSSLITSLCQGDKVVSKAYLGHYRGTCCFLKNEKPLPLAGVEGAWPPPPCPCGEPSVDLVCGGADKGKISENLFVMTNYQHSTGFNTGNTWTFRRINPLQP